MWHVWHMRRVFLGRNLPSAWGPDYTMRPERFAPGLEPKPQLPPPRLWHRYAEERIRGYLVGQGQPVAEPPTEDCPTTQGGPLPPARGGGLADHLP